MMIIFFICIAFFFLGCLLISKLLQTHFSSVCQWISASYHKVFISDKGIGTERTRKTCFGSQWYMDVLEPFSLSSDLFTRKDCLLSKIYCPYSDPNDKCNIIQYYFLMSPKLYFNCLSHKRDALIIMLNCAERTIEKQGYPLMFQCVFMD